MKRIPYGISNFEVLRNENYLYVDKTHYIEILDNYAPYQFFIRPRRFGKSFNFIIKLSAIEFISRYSNLLGNISMPNEIDSAELVVQYISLLASQIDKAIFVLIDEYDNFSNELRTSGKKILMKVYFMERALLKYFIKL